MLFLDPIVDNQQHNLRETYKKLIKRSEEVRIATGYFYVSGFNLYKEHLDNLLSPEELDEKAPFRILMGRETTRPTSEEIKEGMNLREKIEKIIHDDIEDLNNAQMERLERLKDFIGQGLVDVRVNAPEGGMFHAKGASFRMTPDEEDAEDESEEDRRPAATIVGSSNFSKTGHTENIELNLTSQNPTQAKAFEDWFDNQWANSEEFSEDLIEIIEKNKKYQDWKEEQEEEEEAEEIELGTFIEPFEYYKLLAYDALDGHVSKRYDSPLYHFQKRGYESANAKISKYDGCIISDSVGLGKSFIGGELLRDYRKLGKKCLLIVPAHITDQWEDLLQDSKDEDGNPYFNLEVDGTHLKVMSITKFQNMEYDEVMELHDDFDVVLVDEAHRFRNSGRWKANKKDHKGTRRYANLRLFKDKTMLMLSATPLNNSAEDLKNLISLFTDEDELRNKAGLDFEAFDDYIKLSAKRKKIAAGKLDANEIEKQEIIDKLAEKSEEIGKILEEVMILRTRKHVKDQIKEEDDIEMNFNPPEVNRENYRLPPAYRPTYENLPAVMDALHLPHITIKNPQGGGTLKALYKLNLLKRLESSPYAFVKSIETLYHSERLLLSTLEYLPDEEKIRKLQDIEQEQDTTLDDFTENEEVAEELENALEELGFDKTVVREGEDISDELEKATVGEVKSFIYEDISILANFASEFISGIAPSDEKINEEKHKVDNWLREKGIYRIPDVETKEYDTPIYPNIDLEDSFEKLESFYETMFDIKDFKDTKIDRLVDLLSQKEGKAVIFSQYRATADYVYKRLLEDERLVLSEENSAVVKGGDKNKQEIVKRFSPSSSGYQATLEEEGKQELKYVVATDTLSEGVNLQGVDRAINYDLPWNPMRIVQRVGRIDRIGSEAKKYVHNFFPDEDLEAAMKLLKRLQAKIQDIALIVGKENNILDPNEDQVLDRAGVEQQKTIGELELEEIESSVKFSRETDDINELDDISKNALLKKAGTSDEEREAFERLMLKKQLTEEYGLSEDDFNYAKEFFEDPPEERKRVYTRLEEKSAPSPGVLGLMHVWFEESTATLHRTERELYYSRFGREEVEKISRIRQLDIDPDDESSPFKEISEEIKRNIEAIENKVQDKTEEMKQNQSIGVYKKGEKKSKQQEMVIAYLEQKVIPEYEKYKDRAEKILKRFKSIAIKNTEEGRALRRLIKGRALSDWEIEDLLSELEEFIAEHIDESPDYQTTLKKKSEVNAEIQSWSIIGR